MSRNILATFGGYAYDPTLAFTAGNYRGFGATDLLVFDEPWLMATDFYKMNRWPWEHPGDQKGKRRGFGWFVWKPFVALQALAMADEGDVVLYVDGDTYPIASMTPLFEECRRIGGLMLFRADACDHQNWIKRDALIVMGQDDDKWRFRQHGVARFFAVQKGPWLPQQFLMEWLTYNLNPFANTFDPSVLAREYPELREPRCEQAIMTNLAHRMGVKLYREACQFGEASQDDRDLYGQVFFQKDCGRWKGDLRGSEFRKVML